MGHHFVMYNVPLAVNESEMRKVYQNLDLLELTHMTLQSRMNTSQVCKSKFLLKNFVVVKLIVA